MTAASPTISNSLISDNDNGIIIYGASDPKINNCDFINNRSFAINNVNQSFNVDATNCWWGDNSGPTYSANTGGKGGKISDKVKYAPFKTSGASNPLAGDVSLNGSVQAYDASLVLQHAVGSVTLSTAQKSVADVSGDGTITSYDGTLILQYVAGVNNVFPSELRSASIEDLSLKPGEITVNTNKSITIPVLVENGNRALAVDIAASYDNKLLKPIRVEVGKDAKGRLFDYHIDEVAGQIKIALAGTNALGTSAEVAGITFAPVKDLNSDAVTSIIVDRFLVNEKDFTSSAQPIQLKIGEMSTGLISNPQDKNMIAIYPNPVRTDGMIRYHVAAEDLVTITLYDITGRQISVLANGIHSAGDYTVKLNANTSGICFVRMTVGQQTQTLKLIIEQ